MFRRKKKEHNGDYIGLIRTVALKLWNDPKLHPLVTFSVFISAYLKPSFMQYKF